MFSRLSTDASLVESFGDLDGAGPMSVPTETTRLFDLAKYEFDHGTEDERKNLWTGKDSTKNKKWLCIALRAFYRVRPRHCQRLIQLTLIRIRRPCDNEQRSLRDAIPLAVWPEVGLQRDS